MLNTNASASSCSGQFDLCDAFEWDWGDGATGSGAMASHTYATQGTYTVVLTVEEFGVGSATSTRNVTVYRPDTSPTVAGTCAFDPNTWTQTLTDASTDDVGVKQVTVNWGDGSVLAVDNAAPFGPFSRTFINPGTYTITHKAIDTIGQQSTRTCTATPAWHTFSGTVLSLGGSPVGTAAIQVKKGATVVRNLYTAADGSFSIGSLKPATYTLTVTKPGLTFAVPAATFAVGPSSSGNTISATGPLARRGTATDHTRQNRQITP
jgi:PKD repeat protein